jgi:hypothetical protein
MTASSPPGLLAAILPSTSAVPQGELDFTYASDPNDPSWIWYEAKPAPAFASKVDGGYGFAHRVGGAWQVAGPGSSEVGCPGSTQITVPLTVFQSFGLSRDCPDS